MPELLSTQEEADIHPLLYAAKAAAEGHKAVSSSQMKKNICVDSAVLTCVRSKLVTTRLRSWSLIQMIKLCQMTLKKIQNNLDFSSEYLACIN